jgi:hypothetical protein
MSGIPWPISSKQILAFFLLRQSGRKREKREKRKN